VASPCSPYSWYSLDSWSTRKGRTTKDANPTNGEKTRSSERIQWTSDRECTIAKATHHRHAEQVFHNGNRSRRRARRPSTPRAGCVCQRRRTAGCSPRWPRGSRVKRNIESLTLRHDLAPRKVGGFAPELLGSHEIHLRFGLLTFRSIAMAASQVRFCVLGVEPDGLREIDNGLVVLVLEVIRTAAAVIGLVVLGLQPDGLCAVGKGLAILALVGIRNATVAIGFRQFPIEPNRFGTIRDGLSRSPCSP